MDARAEQTEDDVRASGMIRSGDENDFLRSHPAQFRADGESFLDGRASQDRNANEEIPGISFIDQELNRKLTLGPVVLGGAAEHHFWSVASGAQFGAFNRPRSPKLTAQDENQVRGLRRLREREEFGQHGQ